MKTELIQEKIPSSFGDQPLLLNSLHNIQSAPKKETIIFIHGFPDCHDTWIRQLDFFGADYFVAAFDLRGAGQSATPADKSGFGINEVLVDLDAVMNHLYKINPQIDGFHLVAHDWGALLAWSYLSAQPMKHKIKSLVALGGMHPGFMLRNNRDKLLSFQNMNFLAGLEQLLKSWYVGFFQIPILSEMSFTFADQWLYKRLLNLAEVPANDSMHQQSNQRVENNSENTIQLYRQLLQQGPPPLPKEKISIPVLQFILQRDIFISPQSFENQETLCLNYQTRNLNANHWAHRSHAVKVNTIIQEFIDKNN